MEKLLACAMEIGEQMLLSGAEVHRVEKSMRYMCSAFGAVRTDVFIITSSMVVTVTDSDGHIYTQTRRITSVGTNFEKLHRLNELSRRISKERMDEQSIHEELDKISACKTYPLWLECIAYSAVAGSFTIFFGGSFIEMLISMLVGTIVRFVILLCEKWQSNKIFMKFISSLVVTLAALIAVKIGIIDSVDNIIIGNIMVLIPGIGLTNALRDLFIGDSIAGLLRTFESALIALSMAAGYLIIAVLGGIAL